MDVAKAPTMLTSLLLISLGVFVPQGPEDDPQDAAELLGISGLDAEDMAREAIDPFAPIGPPTTATAPSAPGWASLLPQLSIACQYQAASLLTDGAGYALGRLPDTVLLAIDASWPLPEGGERQAPRVTLAQAEGAGEVEPAPKPSRPPPEPREPTVQELQAAAAKAFPVRPAEMKSMRRRARASAWLPQLSAEYRRNVGNIDMVGVRSDEGVDTSALEDVARYGVSATWRLSDIVFSPQEIQAATVTLEVARARREEVEKVTRLYFERRRLLLTRQSAPPADPVEAEKLDLAIGERTAAIDALTGGYLSRRLGGRP